MRALLGAIALLLWLGGCAAAPGRLSLPPVAVIAPLEEERGALLVFTTTDPVNDGGIYYYPHRPYEILSPEGSLIRRVLNHRGWNDEDPMTILLPPGQYGIRTQGGGRSVDVLVEVETGKQTRVYVERLLAGRNERADERDPRADVKREPADL